MLDFILICILATGFATLIAWATGLDNYINQVSAAYDNVYERYGVEFPISEDSYNEMTDEERANCDTAYEVLCAALEENNCYAMTYSLLLMSMSSGLLLSFVILEFVLPLVFKNGQTLGKKVFGLGVVFPNSVRVTRFAMFVRSLLGKYTLETMVPLLIIIMFLFQTIGVLGLILPAGLLILQICVFAFNKNRPFVHDIVSNTVVVDMSSQMIFDSYDDLVSYKANKALENSKKSDY